ncbi:hypothetical protein [Planobispora longispora]|uniref:Uncharacterized protein n=1 Tax=Planobispora longispora TaxID=28887 RepID=A0A8J3RF87_9ACTN|nr:hypothetical protein [Planobispora longispora]BFE78020.1 hypothetical protein GCM10020093_006210 [Planobispora longispora]GIH73620.1 hypothetical protein Plo01_00490 [Planobispora longispora]
MGIWRGPDGIEVEAIMRDDQPCLRVTRTVGHERVLIAYCADVREVNRYVDLADLVPVEVSGHARA